MERALLPVYRMVGFSPLDLPGAVDELRRDVLKSPRGDAVLCHPLDLELLRAKLPVPLVPADAPTATRWPGGPQRGTVWVPTFLREDFLREEEAG